MAIYSFNHSYVSKTLQKSLYTASANIRYISRDSAEPEIFAQHMPSDPKAAQRFMNEKERLGRTNMRVADKFCGAIPRELSEAQRLQLVRDYLQDMTNGQVPYFVAIHQRGKDAYNPHFHAVVRDASIIDGKCVMALSENAKNRAKRGLPGPRSIDHVRERWEHHVNRALERAGHDVRVSRLSLKAQGIDRLPTIHLGPNGQHIEKQIRRPASKEIFNKHGRKVDYTKIDLGRTRREYNNQIIDLNLERAAKSEDFETRAWAKFQKEQRFLDRNLENQLIPEARRRTLEERQMRHGFVEKLKAQKSKKQADLKLNRDWLKTEYGPKWGKLKTDQANELAGYHSRQKKFFIRLWSGLDITGTFRRKQEQTKTDLITGHRAARKAFRQKYRSEAEKRLKTIQERSVPQYEVIKKQRRDALFKQRERHREAETSHDQLWQARETERAQEMDILESTIADWKRMQKRKRVNEKDHDHGRERSRDRGRGPK